FLRGACPRFLSHSTRRRGPGRNFEHCRSHVVARLSPGEFFDGVEYGPEKEIGRVVVEHCAKVNETRHIELVAVLVSRFRKPVRGEQNGVSGRQVNRVLLVARTIEKARRQSSLTDRAAAFCRKMHGKR